MPDFGITIPCYVGDLPFLKGCLASIAYFMPTIPITIIKHGEFDTRALQKRYNLMVIEQKDVDPRLQKKSFGYGFTKMIAFWHAPFDRFVHIDPDSVCRAIR